MEEKLKAEEILDYCISYLSNFDGLETKEFKESRSYKEMLKEIEFMLDTD